MGLARQWVGGHLWSWGGRIQPPIGPGWLDSPRQRVAGMPWPWAVKPSHPRTGLPNLNTDTSRLNLAALSYTRDLIDYCLGWDRPNNFLEKRLLKPILT